MFALIVALAAAAASKHPVVSKHPVAAKHASGPVRKWTVFEQALPADGHKILIATTHANGAAAKPGDGGTPVLGLTCDGRGFYVAVRWPTTLVQASAEGHKVPISWSVDDKPAQKESWEFRGNSAVRSGAEGLRWFHSLAGSKSLTISTANKKASGLATFDLSGHAAVDAKLQELSCGGGAGQ